MSAEPQNAAGSKRAAPGSGRKAPTGPKREDPTGPKREALPAPRRHLAPAARHLRSEAALIATFRAFPIAENYVFKLSQRYRAARKAHQRIVAAYAASVLLRMRSWRRMRAVDPVEYEKSLFFLMYGAR